jgi:hypothetical protein
MAVTFNPVVLSNNPVEDATTAHILSKKSKNHSTLGVIVPMTPLPMPLTTPPQTMMYFVMGGMYLQSERGSNVWEGKKM